MEMALIARESGCKVGWLYYDNAPEAEAAAEHEKVRRERQAALGYDFGYQWPGSVKHIAAHPEHGECWKVTTV
jgi:hypothetical protein